MALRKAAEEAPAAIPPAEQKPTENATAVGNGHERPMTKDEYWRRREERDIVTGERMGRAGAWQAAMMSPGLLQYNISPDANVETYLTLVAKAAEAGYQFSRKA